MSPHEHLSAPVSDLNLFASQLGYRVMLTGLMGDVLNEGSGDLLYDLLAQGKLKEFCSSLGYSWDISAKTTILSLVYDGFCPFLPSSLYYSILTLRAKRQAVKLGLRLPTYVNSEFRQQIIATDKQLKLDLLSEIYDPSGVKRATLSFLYPPPTVLTMAFPFPIERRHPYCDRRLVELVLSMPPQLKWDVSNAKLKGRVSAGRFHHRRAFQDKLPASIINDRVSVEFSPAFNHSITREKINNWLKQTNNIQILDRGYVDGQLWEKHLQSLQNSSIYNNYLVAFLCLESWLRSLDKL